ncbi:MAG: glycosyltransferase [Burkholderiaceae bacterium]|nr:glycosyltransferase [Burkholderiaceae bacterium]
MTLSSLAAPGAVVSVVSHGHGLLVQALLADLARWSAASVRRVVLTQNLPEPEPVPPPGGWPFVLTLIKNPRPCGFGANHNRALAGATEPVVCVINPDVALVPGRDPFAALVQAALQPGVGCAYPEQLDAQGVPQDCERELPTPTALWRRHARCAAETRVDWVNAACIALPVAVWQQLGGFDETYFMYCEDVDLCLRLRLQGWALQRAPVQVVHAGQRASHQHWRHLRWHVRSLFHLWRSPVYAQARRLLLRSDAGTIGAS